MSDNEVNQLTEKMYLMEKNLLQAIADLRVHQAENFVTHKELGEYKTDQKWFIGIAVTVSAIVVSIISNAVNWVRGV